MIFGQSDINSTFDFQEAEVQIRKLLRTPANSVYLQKAKKHQDELKLYVSGDENFKKIILDIARSRMVSQQYEVFAREFKFRTKSLSETIVKHFYNVFEAHGRVYNFDFNNDIESELRFNQIRKTLFKVSDEKYFESYVHRFEFTEPNSVIVSGRDNDNFKSQKFDLEQIHDVGADEAGINYIIICIDVKNDEKVNMKYYYVYDDKHRYKYLKTDGDYLLQEIIEHDAEKCPVTFMSNVNRSENNCIEKSSPISSVIDDGKMQDLFINSITMSYYKARSAYDTQVRPEAKPKQEFKNDIESSNKLDDDSKYLKSFDTKSRNPEMMGQVIEIPYAKMFKADFVGSVLNSVQNIPANIDVLQYHDTYLANLEKDILSTVMGRGVGDALRSSALNEDQVSANFEEQERALDMYSQNVENTWNFVLTRIAEMYSQSFESLKLKLGDKYFLKSEEKLLTELDLMQKNFSNSAQIMQKQFEVFLLKNRDNPKALERYNLISILQPFSYKSQSWVMQNTEALSDGMVNMYNYFEQVLSIFEYENGRIENFGAEMENRSARLERINNEFYSILNNILSNAAANSEEQSSVSEED